MNLLSQVIDGNSLFLKAKILLLLHTWMLVYLVNVSSHDLRPLFFTFLKQEEITILFF